MLRTFRPLLWVPLVLLAACATSTLVTGRVRPAIDPAQVRIYTVPPPGGFEEIAQLDTQSGALIYGEQNKMNSVLSHLRKEAARLGANGVLLVGTENGHGGSGATVGVGGGSFGRHSYGGVGVGVDITPTKKYAHGIAIHVPNPPSLEPQPAPAR
jgi:hypothetical protein